MRRFEYKVMPLPLSDPLSIKQYKTILRELVHRTDGVLFSKREIE